RAWRRSSASPPSPAWRERSSRRCGRRRRASRGRRDLDLNRRSTAKAPRRAACTRHRRPAMAARMRTRMLALALLTVAGRSLAAVPPDVNTLVAKMKAALEPPKESLRQLKLSISGEDGGTTQWTLAQARKNTDGRGRMLTVLLAPKEERGVASLL